VLNLEWSSRGRDREVASLVCAALRRRGHRVVEESVFNYRHLLLEHRPRVLYVAEPAGASLNFEAARFAAGLGVPTISVDAEGSYVDGQVKQMFWGHVTDRRMPQQAKLLWSQRARSMVLSEEPEQRARLKVSGAVGFDRYRLGSFATKEDWRARYGFEHEHVVGYAGWAFDYVFGTRSVSQDMSGFGPGVLERFRRDRDSMREILDFLVASNPRTLFVLKPHPGVVNAAESEIAGLETRPNVLVPPAGEPIGDCINVCDIWSAYDSTTCMEGWLLGKQSLLINPSGADFPRSRAYRGSPMFATAEAVNDALRVHRETGELPGFAEREELRQGLIRDTIQWADGKNHLRAAHYIEQLLDKSTGEARAASRSERRIARSHNLLYRGAARAPRLPGFRHYSAARARFDALELQEATRRAERASAAAGAGLSEDDLAELELVNR
jgi:hypothetical protein